ncbi:pectin lyase fold/virulence factor [Rhizoctonia solani]|nr:pectin lyase fold/virulence factor [Rhizoctonia solani]
MEGGGTAAPIVVFTLDALKTAVQGDLPKVVLIDGVISGSDIVDVGGNTSLLGKSGPGLEGIGLRVNATENISKVLDSTGDAIRTISSSRIWIDSMDLSSDNDNGNSYYGGLIYVTKGTSGISITNSYFHDHWKSVLGGLSDVATEQANVTWAYNKWERLNSRLPTVRWGKYHITCNYYVNNLGSITANVGSDVYIQGNVFESMTNPIVNNGGTVRVTGNSGYRPPLGTIIITPIEFEYPALGCDGSTIKEQVNAGAGAKLDF